MLQGLQRLSLDLRVCGFSCKRLEWRWGLQGIELKHTTNKAKDVPKRKFFIVHRRGVYDVRGRVINVFQACMAMLRCETFRQSCVWLSENGHAASCVCKNDHLFACVDDLGFVCKRNPFQQSLRHLTSHNELGYKNVLPKPLDMLHAISTHPTKSTVTGFLGQTISIEFVFSPTK